MDFNNVDSIEAKLAMNDRIFKPLDTILKYVLYTVFVLLGLFLIGSAVAVYLYGPIALLTSLSFYLNCLAILLVAVFGIKNFIKAANTTYILNKLSESPEIHNSESTMYVLQKRKSNELYNIIAFSSLICFGFGFMNIIFVHGNAAISLAYFLEHPVFILSILLLAIFTVCYFISLFRTKRLDDQLFYAQLEYFKNKIEKEKLS